ncbi:MAG: efflux RND transporter periplasmic adaptor subunit [Calditrichaeota bacterium]|nr:MAG: efflux RND transporter periplasmic adaptor subunit [Calditrichota bacterium]MBL1207738.1 efflux RND transporter periplasmic adaptor subunit [Calditrichota bacterium]NOG47572.1 efflux RND transporter periplasmic adaptor subunit [Calditrichota bacterium]
MKQTLLFLLVFLLAISCDDSDADDALEIIIPVNVTELKRSKIMEFITSTADIMAHKKETALSQSEGFYRLAVNPKTGNPFRPGESIQKGQVVIFIDNPEFENNIAYESKKLNLDISKREYEKQQSLYEKGGVTQRELINAERTFIDSEYAFENAKIQLGKLRIEASFDGIITSLPYYTKGVYISVGQPMCEIMDYKTMYAEVAFPAKELGQVKAGQFVRVTQYNLPGDTLIGTVEQVDPALETQSRSFKSKIVVDNPDNKLRPGMFVKLETIVASQDSALVIPQDVILSKRQGKTVFIVEKSAAQRRVIATGLENEQNVEVLSGLKEGDRLVIKGFETLRHHSKVKIVR